MANQNKTTLKGYFETGDIPNQNQYAELIDSQLNLEETTLQTMKSSLSSSYLYTSNDLIATGSLITTHITASGNISASGKLTTITINTGQGDNECYAMDQDVRTTDNVSFTNITSSGPVSVGTYISASSYISASDAWFGGGATASLQTSASLSEIIFKNLPTTEPLISGALWLSGSNGGTSKYLMVYNG